MAFKLIGEEFCSFDGKYRKEFICDHVEDVGSLPACCAGSMATVPGAGKVYMVNASGEWTEFGGSV